MTNRWQKVYAKPARGASSKTKEAMYQLYRAAWFANHPDASRAEALKALAEIAKKLDL